MNDYLIIKCVIIIKKLILFHFDVIQTIKTNNRQWNSKNFQNHH
jgi:hypothetical protein